MRIKTFEAPTMHEALLLAKKELGEEAVVLNTKHIKTGGLLGIGGNGRVELTAAVDETTPPSQGKVVDELVGESLKTVANTISTAASEVRDSAAMGSFAARLYGESAPAPAETPEDIKQLRAEVKHLSELVHNLLNGQGVQSKAASKSDKPLLLRLGVDEDIANGVLADCLPIEDKAALTAMIAAKLQAFASPPTLEEKEIIALVGPTGVGKTTTLAKMAAKFAIEQGKKVALITADTFRIGAVEQLRTYARIMGVPLEIALSPEEVAAGVEKHRDKDVILIDTVGRSQRSSEHLNELKSFIDAANTTSVHLVIAASLSAEVQKEVLENFRILSPTRLIVTKLDETSSRGCLVNIPLRTGLGLSCMTAGQSVPQDFEFANAGSIARLLTEVA